MEIRVFAVLGGRGGAVRHDQHWTYTVPDAPLPEPAAVAQRLSSSDEVLRELSDGFYGIAYPDVFAIFIGGAVAAAAASSREDDAAAELWVYTRPDHRRHGHGVQVAVAWLRHAVDRGLVPFYSHVRGNTASRRLAEALSLRRGFVVSCYE